MIYNYFEGDDLSNMPEDKCQLLFKLLDINSEEELQNQMQQPFSQFYLDAARNDLDIGIKTFHAYICHALRNVDYACVEPKVLSDIYGNFSEEADYGKHAFVIAKRIHDRSKKNENSLGTGYQYVKAMATAAE